MATLPNPLLQNPNGMQILAGPLVVTGAVIPGAIAFESTSVTANGSTGLDGSFRMINLVLTGNVAIMGIGNFSLGVYLLAFTQDATGGRTVTFATPGFGVVDPTPNKTSTQLFWFDGALVAIGDMVSF